MNIQKYSIRKISSFLLGILFLQPCSACTTGSTIIPESGSESEVEYKQHKLISYNIRYSLAAEQDGRNCWDNRKEASVKMIRDQQPLVFGLQEACADQLEYLDAYLSEYKHIGVGRDNDKEAGETMTIYYDTTKLTLVNSGTFWLSATPEKPSLGWDGGCNRTCTWGIFEIKDYGVSFISDHYPVAFSFIMN